MVQVLATLGSGSNDSVVFRAAVMLVGTAARVLPRVQAESTPGQCFGLQFSSQACCRVHFGQFHTQAAGIAKT